jgi:hypothetical protein
MSEGARQKRFRPGLRLTGGMRKALQPTRVTGVPRLHMKAAISSRWRGARGGKATGCSVETLSNAEWAAPLPGLELFSNLLPFLTPTLPHWRKVPPVAGAHPGAVSR